MDTYRIFDIETEKLAAKVVEMGMQVQKQINGAIEALKWCNLQLANEVIENDKKVDSYDVKIDKHCQRIFALQQPVASDLRYILSALKINNDLERIGDHAVSIAKRVEKTQNDHQLIANFGVDKVGYESAALFAALLELIKSHNLELCEQVFSLSGQLKDNCEAIVVKILSNENHSTGRVAEIYNLLIIINLIERIASYSNNIAESITFVVKGEIIKHRRE